MSGSRGKEMDDLNRAYQVLGVNASMSLEEIEAIYDELVLKYKKEAKRNMYYRQKLEEWEEAYDCIMESRLEELDEREEEVDRIYPSLSSHSNHLVKEIKIGIIVGLSVLIMLGMVLIEQLYFNEQLPTQNSVPLTSDVISSDSSTELFHLANQFTLKLGKFKSSDEWDWGYYENGNTWTIVVAFEVTEATNLGALVNLNNFRLNSDYPTSRVPEDVYLDSDVNHIHYLGAYSEIVPKSQKFGVVFNVNAFYEGEERFIYYHHPDGRVQNVGSLVFEQETHGIYVDSF